MVLQEKDFPLSGSRLLASKRSAGRRDLNLKYGTVVIRRQLMTHCRTRLSITGARRTIFQLDSPCN